MYETFSKQDLNSMTSDSYKAAFEGPDGEAFRARVMELENQPRQAAQPAAGTRPANARAATPGETSFDPSFDGDEQPAPVAPAAAQPAAQPAAVVEPSAELPEKIHEYQPVDRNGKKVGGLQRFKYRTDAELIQKLTAAHMASSARIRELSRDRKLDSIAAAGAAPRIQPEKEVPTTVEGLAAELRAQRESNFVLSVRAAVNEFQASVGWTKYRSNENAKSVILAVERAGDDPTDPAAYQRAFHNMEQFLEPVAAEKTAAPVAAVAPTPAPVDAPAPVVRPSSTARIATGLNNSDQTSGPDPFEVVPVKVQGQLFTMPDGKKQVLTALDLQRMSTDVMKRLLRSPDNARKADILWQQVEDAKAAARGQR